MTNFSQLPLDCRRIIVAYLKGNAPTKTYQELTSENERWGDLFGILLHTILSGPSGDAVLEQALRWTSCRGAEASKEAKRLRMLPLIEKLLLKCKIASV